MTAANPSATPADPRANEQRFESLFNATPVAIWEEDFSAVRALLDERGLLQCAAPAVRTHVTQHPEMVAECVARVLILDVNREAVQMHRARDKAELLAGLDRLVTPESHEALVEQLIAIATGVTTLEIDTRVRTLDGEMRDVHLRWHVVPGCEQTCARVIVSTTDITERRRAGATLRMQAAALAAADDGIMITDRDGSIEWVNPAFERMTGYTLPEVRGKSPRLLKSGVQDAAFYEAFWRTVLAGQVVRGEIVNRRKDGTLFDEQETITPVTEAGGRITHFIAIKQDITARKRAEAALRESESRFRLMFERTADALLLLDPAINQFIDCNQAAADLLRCPDCREMLAVHPSRLSPPCQPDGRASPEKADEMIATAMREGSHRFEWIHCSTHRADFPVEVLLTPISLGQRTLLLTTWRDITNRKRAEQQVRQLNRTYAVLSDINQLIVRQRDPAAILDGACRIAIEKGGFVLAWVERRDAPGTPPRLAARAGATAAMQSLIEQMLPTPAHAETPAGSALRTGQPMFCNAIADDPAAATWRDAARAGGFRAMAALPLVVKGRCTGTFNLCAAQADLFDADEVRLLTELADDLGYALDSCALEEQRRQADAALRESEARFRTVLETVALIGLMLDRAGRIALCSDHLLALTGWSRAEVIGRDWFEMFIPADGREPLRREVFTTSLSTGALPRHFENEIVTRAGGRRLIAWSNSIVRDHDGAIIGVASLGEDITDRRRAEAEILQERNFNQAAIESLPGLFYLFDQAGHFLRWNRNFELTSGYSAPEIAQMAPLDFFREPDRQLIATRIHDAFTTGEAFAEAGFVTRTGDAIPHFFTGRRFDYDGRPCILGMGVDITERKRAETAARHLASFPELNPNPVLEFAADGTLRYRNPASQAMAQRVGVSDVEELLPAEIPAIVRECLATRAPRMRLQTRHGGHTLSWSFYPITLTDTVHCYAGDITERLLLEEQLRQSQKMDAIGHLAGGVAHDFNNLLTVIQGNTSLLKLDDLPADHRADAMEQIAQAAERAAGLTRQLLAFGRRQIMQVRQLDLNEVVTNLAKMLQRIVGEDVRLQLNLHPRPLQTCADAGMLDQVLMNLVVNARDAMPAGGQLFLETTTTDVATADVALFSEARPGPHVGLRVRDTGCGIAAENLPHIFEPFFTTKEPGKGTGLGLATVFGIVKQHRGILRVASEVGRGTTFEVLLPVAVEDAAATGMADVAHRPRGGTESILLVEDEGPVRQLVERVLSMQGYRVLVVATGAEVLQRWNTAPVPVDLVLTDIIMPGGVSGRDLAERLRAQRPGLRVIYMSGYTGDVAGRGLHLHEGVNFLQKPFGPTALLECVRACLDAS